VLGDGIAVPTIGSIEVYKSPQPSQFGSGYAAVNILPKYMKKEGQEGILGLNGGSYGSFDENVSAGSSRDPSTSMRPRATRAPMATGRIQPPISKVSMPMPATRSRKSGGSGSSSTR
jgi:hypothetical protein